jgi:hypothetical protein
MRMDTEPNSRAIKVRPCKLWFGLAASAVAWVVVGAIDLLIVWFACAHQKDSTGGGSYMPGRTLSFIVAVVLFVFVLAAGFTSYRNWKALSPRQTLLDATADERHEFVAMIGVIVSITLGMGIIWLALPPLWIQLCERAK